MVWAAFWAIFSQAHLATLLRVNCWQLLRLPYPNDRPEFRVARFFLVHDSEAGKKCTK
jgi:hypothetical protein